MHWSLSATRQGSEAANPGSNEKELDTEAVEVGWGSTSYWRPKGGATLSAYAVDPVEIGGTQIESVSFQIESVGTQIESGGDAWIGSVSWETSSPLNPDYVLEILL